MEEREKSAEHKVDAGMTRRQTLVHGLRALTTTAFLLEAKNSFAKSESREYNMGELTHIPFRGYFTLYTGIEGRPNPVEKINFKERLKRLWSQKMLNIEERPGLKVDPKLARAGIEILWEYFEKDPVPMEFAHYERHVEGVARGMRLDWEKVQRIKSLDKVQLAQAEKMAAKIRGHELLSYSMTEIMPNIDGKSNVMFLEFLLKNAGVRFVNSIPALGDAELSYGPYQFTPNALHDDGKEIRGASILARAMKGTELPKEVIELRGSDHHRAAWLFAINNAIDVIKNLDAKTAEKFVSLWKNPEEVVAFIAASHHGQTKVRANVIAWLNAGAEGSIIDALSDDETFKLKTYALRSIDNYRALEARKKPRRK